MAGVTNMEIQKMVEERFTAVSNVLGRLADMVEDIKKMKLPVPEDLHQSAKALAAWTAQSGANLKAFADGMSAVSIKLDKSQEAIFDKISKVHKDIKALPAPTEMRGTDGAVTSLDPILDGLKHISEMLVAAYGTIRTMDKSIGKIPKPEQMRGTDGALTSFDPILNELSLLRKADEKLAQLLSESLGRLQKIEQRMERGEAMRGTNGAITSLEPVLEKLSQPVINTKGIETQRFNALSKQLDALGRQLREKKFEGATEEIGGIFHIDSTEQFDDLKAMLKSLEYLIRNFPMPIVQAEIPPDAFPSPGQIAQAVWLRKDEVDQDIAEFSIENFHQGEAFHVGYETLTSPNAMAIVFEDRGRDERFVVTAKASNVGGIVVFDMTPERTARLRPTQYEYELWDGKVLAHRGHVNVLMSSKGESRAKRKEG